MSCLRHLFVVFVGSWGVRQRHGRSYHSPGGVYNANWSFDIIGESRTSPLSIVVVLALASFAFGTPPTIQIPRINTPPSLADFEDMQPSAGVAGHMVKVTGFIAREPADGADPTQDTNVYLA